MKDMLENYLLGAVACTVMGVALIINPHIITDVLNTAVGVILIIWAAFGLIRFIAAHANGARSHDGGGAGLFSLIANILLLACGIYVFVNQKLLETIVMVALGLYLICTGLPKLIAVPWLRAGKASRWKTSLVTSLITVLLGAFIVLYPIGISGTIMRFVGVALTIAGITSLVSGVCTSKLRAELEKTVEYSRGRGRDRRDTKDHDKKNAIDVDVD